MKMRQKTDRPLRKLIPCTLGFLLCLGGGRAQSKKAAGDFPLERDHIFVWVSEGAPEAAALEKLGLQTDRRINKHTGQGTSSIVFYFENAYLELIWVDDEDVAAKKDNEAGSGAAHMVERARWRETGASPFGVGLHRRAGATGAIPFPTRKYWAEWMKPDTFIEFATSASNAGEPLCFVVPESIAVPPPEKLRPLLESRPELRKLFAHPLGARELTGVKITVSGVSRLSTTASLLSKNGIATIEKGKAPELELTFDGGSRGKSLDARPTLPITLKY
jgi:hypothetical protein